MMCPRCNKEMANVMHFEKNTEYAFHTCKHCKQQTHRKRIHYDTLEKNLEREGKNYD